MTYFKLTGSEAKADLSSLDFAEPEHIVQLACEATWHKANSGVPLRAVAPNTYAVANYLSRMGIKPLFDRLGVAHDFASSGKNAPHQRFVELTPIGAGLPSGVVPFWELLLARINHPSNMQMLLTSIAELELNVNDHAAAGGFMTAQYYPAVSTVRLSVGDPGRGIPTSLRAVGKTYATDSAAIIDSVKARITSSPDAMRGYGLHYLRRDVVDTLGGRLVITSERGCVTWTRSGAIPTDSRDAVFRGTLVEAHIPTGGPK